MSEFRFLRDSDRMDAAPAPEGPLDTAPLTGSWLNTDPSSPGIRAMRLAGANGALRLRVCSSFDWGEAPIETLYTDGIRSRTGAAFTARFDLGFLESHLQGNVNQGLLILAGFQTFRDGSGRSDHFVREFYHAVEDEAVAWPPARAADPGAARLEGKPIHPAPLLGIWHNTNARARGIVRIDLAPAGGGLAVRVHGAGSPGSIDWGETPAGVFAYDAGSTKALGFSALYDHGFLRTLLQANIKQGVLVVASFNEFVDGSGRSSYFTREFFYR
jgi:hypothetical protein